MKKPFISTIFAKSYYLVRDYKHMAVAQRLYFIAGDFRNIEIKYFFSIIKKEYKFNDELEDTFNVNLFISDMNNIIKKYNYNLELLRDFKLSLLTNKICQE